MGAPLVPVPRHPGIYRRGSRYAVRYTKPDGRPGQRSARTLAEARKLKAALTADVARGEYRETSTLTLAAYAATWARTYRGRTGRGIRPQSLAEYEADLRLHVLPRLGHMRLTAITPQDIKLLAHDLERSGSRRKPKGAGLSPASVRNALAPLRALLATATEDGLIRHNPAVGLRFAGARRGKVKHLEPEELARLHAETPEEHRLFVRLLAYTGARISEFIELRWADVDLRRRTVSITRRRYRRDVDDPKSAYGVRTLPLTAEVAGALAAHKLASPYSANADPIFATLAGTPVHPSNAARRWFKPAARRAGVGWASFHTLRHTCGTLLARRGLRAEQIQAWLGHHSASFTQDTYIGRPNTLPDPDAGGLDALADGP